MELRQEPKGKAAQRRLSLAYLQCATFPWQYLSHEVTMPSFLHAAMQLSIEHAFVTGVF
jgi:hypothetical protein